MKLPLLILALVLLFTSGAASGQNYARHTLHMRDGTAVKGTILQKTNNRSLIFHTEQGQDVEISYSQIKSVARNSRPVAKPVNKEGEEEPQPGLKQKGFINITEAEYGLGNGQIHLYGYSYPNSNKSISLRTVNGYQFNRYVSLGAGVGVVSYRATVLFPLTLDARLALSRSYFSPVINLNAGYAANLANGGGGFTASPSFGFRAYLNNKNALLLNVGYKWLEAPVRTWGGSRNRIFQFVTFSAGPSF